MTGTATDRKVIRQCLRITRTGITPRNITSMNVTIGSISLSIVAGIHRKTLHVLGLHAPFEQEILLRSEHFNF